MVGTKRRNFRRRSAGSEYSASPQLCFVSLNRPRSPLDGVNPKLTAKSPKHEYGAEEGLRDLRGARPRPLRRGPPLHLPCHRRGLRRQVSGPVAAGGRPGPRARRGGGQAGAARRQGQPGRGAGARGVRGRDVDAQRHGPVLRHGPAGLAPPPPRRAGAGARGGRGHGAARAGAGDLPPPRGGPPRRQAGERPRGRGRCRRRRRERGPAARAAGGLRVCGVDRGRGPGHRGGARGHAPLRGARGGGRRGVRRQGGRVERRRGDVRAAHRRGDALRRRDRGGGAGGRAARQRAVPAEAVRRRVPGRQGPHEAHVVPRRLEEVFRGASPRSPMDHERRRSSAPRSTNLKISSTEAEEWTDGGP